MKSVVRPELPTASVGSSQAPTAAVDNSAPLLITAESTYKSGKSVQTTGATSVTDYRIRNPASNTYQARLYGSAIAAVKEKGTLSRRCWHRPVQYLNNILEQDHRAIKRRVKAKQSFREFRAAGRTIAGYEAIHMIRKGQARWISDNDVRQQNRFIDQLFDLAA